MIRKVFKKTEMPEAAIQKKIIEWLKKNNFFYWRNNVGVMPVASGFIRFGAVGSPDIFVLKEGRLFGLEVKALRGKQSQNQREFEGMMNMHGGVYRIVRSVEEVKSVLI